MNNRRDKIRLTYCALVLLWIMFLIGCGNNKEEMESGRQGENIAAAVLSEPEVMDIVKEAPVFVEIAYQTPDQLVLRGGHFLAVYKSDPRKENYVFQKAIDLAPQEIAMIQGDFVGITCFREQDVLMSPAHEGVKAEDEPIYQYEYGSENLIKFENVLPGGLDGLSGWRGTGIHYGEGFEKISQELSANELVLLELCPLALPEKAAGTRFAGMEYGLLAADDSGNLTYGLSDGDWGNLLLFPLWQN